jgi:hypothetical protein
MSKTMKSKLERIIAILEYYRAMGINKENVNNIYIKIINEKN